MTGVDAILEKLHCRIAIGKSDVRRDAGSRSHAEKATDSLGNGRQAEWCGRVTTGLSRQEYLQYANYSDRQQQKIDRHEKRCNMYTECLALENCQHNTKGQLVKP